MRLFWKRATIRTTTTPISCWFYGRRHRRGCGRSRRGSGTATGCWWRGGRCGPSTRTARWRERGSARRSTTGPWRLSGLAHLSAATGLRRLRCGAGRKSISAANNGDLPSAGRLSARISPTGRSGTRPSWPATPNRRASGWSAGRRPTSAICCNWTNRGRERRRFGSRARRSG